MNLDIFFFKFCCFFNNKNDGKLEKSNNINYLHINLKQQQQQ
jgi:hypothetical protein